MIGQALNFLKAGTGLAARACITIVFMAAIVAAVFWPSFLLWPMNVWAAIGVGVPYALLAGFAVVSGIKRKGRT